jgi:hypothetical protein
MEVTATQLLSDEGTILVFLGETEDGETVTFAADHRPGRDIAAAIERGDSPICEIPEYMLLGRTFQPGETP